MKITLGLVTVLALFLAVRFLPVGDWVREFSVWVGGIGLPGVALFAAVYVAATMLLVPGAIFTITAGFVFGLGWGLAAASAGSTIGAALAFLIGRFLAREKVESWTKDYPKFGNLDRSIGKRGARLIFLLRLSPLIPFNLSNYFYGLTAVRFFPYVLASWIGMLPGTLLYVYLGSLGRAGIEAAAGAETGRSPLEWAFLAAGLVATAVVTVWISQIARKALRDTEENVSAPKQTGLPT